MYIPYIICDFPTDPSFSSPFLLLLALPFCRFFFCAADFPSALSPSSVLQPFLLLLALPFCRFFFCAADFPSVLSPFSVLQPSLLRLALPLGLPFFRAATLPSALYSSSVLPVLFLEGWLAIYMNYTVFCFNEVACLCLEVRA